MIQDVNLMVFYDAKTLSFEYVKYNVISKRPGDNVYSIVGVLCLWLQFWSDLVFRVENFALMNMFN